MHIDNRFALLVLWLAFLIRGLFYVSVTPLWEGFDEPAHFSYIQHIAEGQGLFPNRDGHASQEIVLSVRLAPKPWMSIVGFGPTQEEYWALEEADRNDLQARLHSIPRHLRTVEGSHFYGDNRLENYQAQHPPLYYLLMALPYRLLSSYNVVERVFAIRILSLLIASTVVFLAFRLANLVFGNAKISLAITGILIFMPQLMMDVCRVGNDSLAIALFSSLMLVTIANPSGGHGKSLLIGILLGLGLLTKAYFLTAIPAIPFVYLMRLNRRDRSLKKAVLSLAIVGLVATLLGGWWYVKNAIDLGAPLGSVESVALEETTLLDKLSGIPEVDWEHALKAMVISHVWYGNGSGLKVRIWMYRIFKYLFLLSGFGLLLGVCFRWMEKRSRPDSIREMLCISSFYSLFWFGLLYHVLLIYLVLGISTTKGWYLYTVIAAELVLLAYGFFSLLPVNWRGTSLGAMIVSFCLLDLYGIFFLLIPYYTGLIRHNSAGERSVFNPFAMAWGDYLEVISRLTVNKPWYMETGFYAAMVVVFLLISLSALFFCLGRLGRQLFQSRGRPETV